MMNFEALEPLGLRVTDCLYVHDHRPTAPEGVINVSKEPAPECTCHQPWNFGHAADCKWKEAQSCSDE